ncbi:MAG: hypothetical protein JWQ30_146 [Sediminibacterium sp.]|nr:hypothetical protein [Sediminibacterium sp.]
MTFEEIYRFVFDNPSAKVLSYKVRNRNACLQDEFKRIKLMCVTNGIEVSDQQIKDFQLVEENKILSELAEEMYTKYLDDQEYKRIWNR